MLAAAHELSQFAKGREEGRQPQTAFRTSKEGPIILAIKAPEIKGQQ